ncbi:helicase [Gigaspora margarita]|uniref:Helicase n=1 Tax=Gigaspora margarita TaxID=4874 RepID=A0A8H4A1X9_GIGMA|nr:helicase [Gigaspora margarita]
MITGKTKDLRQYLNYLAKNKANIPCIIWISYRKTFSNESMGKINDFKLSGLRICNYQDEQNFLDINTAWGELDCVVYTNTVEVGISFEKSNHFDIVIGITNIGTPVNVEAFILMMFRIRDCEKCILSLYYQKISSEFSRSPGHENICAELVIARPNNLPIAINGYYEWDKNNIFYKLDQFLTIISFIEVEYQKCLSARNFIEISSSLIASTGASLKLIKMDESREVIEIRKTVRNKIRVKVLVIKYTITLEKAESLKLDSECSVADTIAFKHFYIWNLYSRNGISIEEDICYNTKDNFEKSVAKDLCKTYSANYWEAIRGLLQLLGFTGIDDKCILFNDKVKVVFEASCEKFIEIRNQSLLLFGLKSHTKEIPDIKSAIKAINAIVNNYCGFDNQEEVIARKLGNSKYHSIVPVLLSYKPKISDEIQDIFDSISIINNITSEYVEHKISVLSSNTIGEKALFLEIPIQNQLIDSNKKNPSQDTCYVDTTIDEASTIEKKIPKSLALLIS